MTDVSYPATQTELRAEFQHRAEQTRTELHWSQESATSFLHMVDDLARAGETLSAVEVENGRRILETIEKNLTLYSFNAALLAAQEDTPGPVPAVDAVTREIELAEEVMDRLGTMLPDSPRPGTELHSI